MKLVDIYFHQTGFELEAVKTEEAVGLKLIVQAVPQLAPPIFLLTFQVPACKVSCDGDKEP